MRIMYSILNILYTNKAQSKLYALTQKDIEEALIADGEKWCERTVYNSAEETYHSECGSKSGIHAHEPTGHTSKCGTYKE